MPRKRKQAALWIPSKLRDDLPPYMAVLAAIEDGLESGELAPGTKLAPHRTLAAKLGFSISTVGKAYREAAARGYISGHTGQGTFALSATTGAAAPSGESAGSSDLVNLGGNFPPAVGQDDAVSRAVREICRDPAFGDLLNFGPHQGIKRHCEILRQFLTGLGGVASAQNIVVTNGAQHGLDIALQVLASNGAPVLVEQLTYVGFKALMSARDHKMIPVEMDAEGLIPDALEREMVTTGARILYAAPTLQSPTARTMSPARRREIAAILRRQDGYLIEDDTFGFLAEGMTPIAAIVPERTIYIMSFAKILGVGLRVGAAVFPAGLVDRANLAVRATAWITAPLLVEIVAWLIQSGAMTSIIDAIRLESAERQAIFRNAFGDSVRLHERSGEGAAFHAWLPLPGHWQLQDFYYAALNKRILVTTPGTAIVDGAVENGVRLCLGGQTTRSDLARALRELSDILTSSRSSLLSFV